MGGIGPPKPWLERLRSAILSERFDADARPQELAESRAHTDALLAEADHDGPTRPERCPLCGCDGEWR